MNIYKLVACFFYTIVMFLANTVSAEPLYKSIETFSLYRYGSGYDISADRQAESGQPCINFVLDAKNMIEDTSNSGLNHSFESVTSVYQLVDKMNLSVTAQIKSITAEANAGLDILKNTETHRFSQTDIFWSYNVFSTKALKPETLSYKPDVQALLEDGISGADKFFARCGDAFVIGIKNAGYYYGVSFIDEDKTSSIDKMKITFNFNYKTGTSYKAAVAYEKNRVEKESLKKVKIEVETSDTTLSGKKPETLLELKQQWKVFTPSKESAQPISLVVAPYSVIGTNQTGVLEDSLKETKLKILLRALWDLRTMKQEVSYIMTHEKEFSFGLPRNKILIDLRKKNLGRIKTSWRNEYESLLSDTKSCIKNFTKTCKKLSDWYDAHPRITERNILPKKYNNHCYGEYIIKPDFKNEHLNLSSKIKGNNEMGGGPVKVVSTLKIYPDERQLKLNLYLQAEQDKKDHTTFITDKTYTIFDLDPEHAEMGNLFQECEFADSPINKAIINAPTVYGSVSALTEKNPRGFIPFGGSGILKRISCEVDGSGNDHKRVACKDFEISNFQVKLQNKLDRDALEWSPSQLVIAPTIKSLTPKRTPVKIRKNGGFIHDPQGSSSTITQ